MVSVGFAPALVDHGASNARGQQGKEGPLRPRQFHDQELTGSDRLGSAIG